MGVYIKGMEMPTEGNWKTVRIYPDGTCAVPNWQGDCTLIKGTKAVPVSPHGRLIDADALPWEKQGLLEADEDWALPCSIIENAPTVIEAEEGE